MIRSQMTSSSVNAGLIRSISRKGCFPDNSACEGFFGRIKNEIFCGRSWQGVTVEEFFHQIEETYGLVQGYTNQSVDRWNESIEIQKEYEVGRLVQ